MDKKVGLKVGLEIHQQLNTHKLFCNCPSELRDDSPDIRVERYLHAVAGETGKVDVAADYEQARKRKFIYEAYSDSTCLVELDESPPIELNKDALFTALQISLLLNAKPLPAIQIMRKTVINGSNTSGFQRTVLIATDGHVKTRHGKVGIATIVLEEDAARIIKKEKDQVTYRLDRLGIPLIEIATDPDIKSAEQAREVAAKLGEILRATNVKRGIGTIRQDVNLSIRKGVRVEVKGVQDLRLISKIIEKEVERQLGLLKKKRKVKEEVRKALPDGRTEFLRPLPGGARMYPETDLPIIHITSEMLEHVKDKLPRLREEEQADLEKLGIHTEIASQIVRENLLQLFNQLLKTKVNPNLIAKTLTVITKNIAAHHKVSTSRLTRNSYEAVLEAFYKDMITKDAIEEVLTEIVKGQEAKKAISKFKALSKSEVGKIIKTILKKQPKLKENQKALMGVAMKQLRGKADGKLIAEVVGKAVK